MKQVISASTSYPNTPETDKEEEVYHDVTVNINNEHFIIHLLAKDPLDAMDITHRLTEEEIKVMG